MQQLKGNQVASASELPTLYASPGPVAKKRFDPPKWIGWAFVSVGTVLVLHSLAMKKPGG
jgi:hypothetical protein